MRPARRNGVSGGTAVRPADFNGVNLLVIEIDFVVRQQPAALIRLRDALLVDLLPHVGSGHHMLSGGNRNDYFEPFAGPVQHVLFPVDAAGFTGSRETQRRGNSRRVAADGEAFEQAPVETDFEHLLPAEPLDVILVVGFELHADAVIAIDRKVVFRRNAAAGAERHVLVLPPVLAHVEGYFVGCRRRTRGRQADREPRHLPRHGHVTFHMGGGERQRSGDIVEAAVRGRVARQQLHYIDINAK